MRRRAAIAGVAGVLTVAAAAGAVVALRTSDSTATLTPRAGATYVTATPTTEPTSDPEPTESPARTRPPEPSPDPTTPWEPSGVPRAATADPPRAPGGPLPTNCLSFGHGCAYAGATGAITGGVDTFSTRRVGPTSVRVAWSSVNLQGNAGTGPVIEFVVNVYRDTERNWGDGPTDPSKLRRIRVSRTTFQVTVDGLTPGETYQFWVQELNSSGLSPGMGLEEQRIPAPSPTATATTAKPATTSPTASPSVTATASPSATP